MQTGNRSKLNVYDDSAMLICENCGKEYKDDQWFGCCSCDCYIGRIRGHSMKQFLELVNTMQREKNKYV